MKQKEPDNLTTSGIIALTTDFGQADWYVGVMKGVLLAGSPGCRPVDVCHAIPPGDVRAGAFCLLNSVPYFPAGTIHVAVVDPGVGSARRALVAQAGGHYFVGPDNGIFSFILERLSPWRAVAAEEERWALKPISTTFHGRDLFAPLAAALLNGHKIEELGTRLEDPVLLSFPRPRRIKDGRIQAEIIHVDRFGNLVTNLRREDPAKPDGPLRVSVAGAVIDGPRRCYEEAAEGELLLLWGSGGYLEISVCGGSAQTVLQAKVGDKVELTEDGE